MGKIKLGLLLLLMTLVGTPMTQSYLHSGRIRRSLVYKGWHFHLDHDLSDSFC